MAHRNVSLEKTPSLLLLICTWLRLDRMEMYVSDSSWGCELSMKYLELHCLVSVTSIGDIVIVIVLLLW